MITVTFGTVASEVAYSIFAPWRMMPSFSTWEPTRKPGTSIRYTSGTLKASHMRMKGAALLHRLVGHHTHRVAACAREADDDIPGPGGLDLEPRVAVEHRLDDLAHVVGCARVDRNDLVQALDGAVRRITGLRKRRRPGVARRQIGQEAAHRGDAFLVALDLVVADAGLVAVDLRAAHVMVADLLAGRGLDEARAAQRHRGRVLDHGHEIGEAGDVGGARGAGPEHGRDLRDDA